MSDAAARRAALEAFLAQDPDDAFTRYALALDVASAGDTARALALLDETISRTPGYVPAYHQRAALLARLGRRDEAETAYRDGIAAALAAGEKHAASEMTQELESLQEDE